MVVEISSRKEQIRLVATHMFRNRGYVATSMRDLAKEIGIEPASLYSHIPSKETLLNDICLNLAQAFVETAHANIDPSEHDPQKHFQLFIDGHLSVILQNLDAAAVFFHEWKHLNQPIRSRFEQLRADYLHILTSIIEEGVRHGTFKNLPKAIYLNLIFSSMNNLHEWYDPQGKITPDELKQWVHQFLQQAILLR